MVERALVLLAVVTLLTAGCDKEKHKLGQNLERLEELAKTACACEGADALDCWERFDPEHERLADTLYKGGAKLSQQQRERFLELNSIVARCKPAGKDGKQLLDDLNGLIRSACACSDAACVLEVDARFNEWAVRFDAARKDWFGKTVADMGIMPAELDALAGQYDECIEKYAGHQRTPAKRAQPQPGQDCVAQLDGDIDGRFPALTRECDGFCGNGLWVRFEPKRSWPKGTYRFLVEQDGKQGRCTASIPHSSPCGKVDCTGDLGLTAVCKEDRFSSMSFFSYPKNVKLQVLRDDSPVGEFTLAPTYRAVPPPSGGCQEAVCCRATPTVTLEF